MATEKLTELVAKWRAEGDRFQRMSNKQNWIEGYAYIKCANELDAVLAGVITYLTHRGAYPDTLPDSAAPRMAPWEVWPRRLWSLMGIGSFADPR